MWRRDVGRGEMQQSGAGQQEHIYVYRAPGLEFLEFALWGPTDWQPDRPEVYT